MFLKSIKVPFVFAVIALTSSSCIKTYYLGRIPQAQFTYPNSNVTPLNKVKGKSRARAKFMSPPSVTSSVMSEAFYDALKKSQGADVLINIDAYQKVTFIPPLPFFFSKYLVEGTAAKQEVGKQKLSQ